MIIKRDMEQILITLASQYPVVTVTGPRQSGKTILVQSAFSEYDYISLEDPDIREMAIEDPRGFFKKHTGPLILDEIQRAPQLISYIQGIVDREKKSGRFILTGSHQFELMSSINQSLAGRTAILKLLPFTIKEQQHFNIQYDIDNTLLKGLYPGIHEKSLNHTIAYKNYFETYIERDLRQIINIKDLRLFRKFVKLCAGRVGQIFSAHSLANDVGVTTATIQSWISVLEASFIIFMIEPFYANIGKRLIKSPKLYFNDTGLASYLLGIETKEQISRDPLRGNLFENLIMLELVKKRYNQGLDNNVVFYRDNNSNEIDFLIEDGISLIPMEVKSADTFTRDFLRGINYIKKLLGDRIQKGYVVYTGQLEQEIDDIFIVNYRNINSLYN
jgi:predicted AAA+ superfamily ATPase